MKKLLKKPRVFVALSLLAALAACGGYTTVTVGGSVSGLVTSGLVLAMDGVSLSVPVSATSYVFPNQIDSHGRYAVSVKTQPPRLTCYVAGGSGLATGIAISTANVICTVNVFTVGGTITGLTGSGLQLTNGSDNLTIDAGATTFKFAQPVPDDGVYGVAVLTQPGGQFCTVKNGTATIKSAAVDNIEVSCK